jgi:hypothetical protein
VTSRIQKAIHHTHHHHHHHHELYYHLFLLLLPTPATTTIIIIVSGTCYHTCIDFIPLMRRTSHVTRHTSHVTRHTSHVTPLLHHQPSPCPSGPVFASALTLPRLSFQRLQTQCMSPSCLFTRVSILALVLFECRYRESLLRKATRIILQVMVIVVTHDDDNYSVIPSLCLLALPIAHFLTTCVDYSSASSLFLGYCNAF